MNGKIEVSTDKAPPAVGAYSQGIDAGMFVFTSGSLPLNPGTGTMPADIGEAAAQALDNLKAILEAAGCGMDSVCKATIYLVDINDFAAVNAVYSRYFEKPYPARSCFAVAALPLGARVEIELVAVKRPAN